MTVKGDIQGLQLDAEVVLFVVDLSRYGQQVLRFHAGTNKLKSDVIWQGYVYTRYPVQATGFEFKSTGTLPRPHFTAANITGVVSAMCREFSDLVGVPVTRKRTLARYLDAANYPNGNPLANPDDHFPDDVFFVNQKVRETADVVEFELAVAFDVEGVQLPRRQVITNSCPWKYRGDGCGYAGGPVADINDAPTADPALDNCGKRLASCRMRFITWMPYGGFPGVSQYR
jgi:lambda family phage minor tail protein L